MFYYLVVPAMVIGAHEGVFTYHSQAPLAVGTLVRIGIGKKEANGLILSEAPKPDFVTKPIKRVLLPRPLPEPLIKLAQWLSSYYVAPLPIVLQTVLPSGLHKKRRQLTGDLIPSIRVRTNIVLNKEQLSAIDAINAKQHGTVLLHGVTGSGKTQVYIEAAKYEQAHGRSSIILVPEISLTPQLVAEFAHHFKNIIVTHSRMSEAERHVAWLATLETEQQGPVIVIGPRSALFAPLSKVGLIVVDECHEPSFKQEQTPRYSALRAASMLARFHEHAKTVLGSATPSVADYYLASSIDSPILTLTQTATGSDKPTTVLIDSKNRDNFREHRFLSDQLLALTRQALLAEKQTLLFHNRRGTAPTSLCATCGWIALCPNCQAPFTFHADQHRLLCHLCGTSQPLPPSCPICGQPEIIFKGIGTKLVEQEVHRLFPKARIARFDADNSADESLVERYQHVYNGDVDIIIGTQLLAKGLDLPHLRVVGVVQADSGLQLPDYQAEERTFQLLYQVAGRVGRGNHPSYVVVQTYQPDHPAIQSALRRDYQTFYTEQLIKRHKTAFPPFVQLLKLTCMYKTEAGAVRAAQVMAQRLRHEWPDATILGPTPSFYEHLGGNFRWQLLIKSKRRADLVAIARQVPTRWQADLDPASLL
jgi:primosomal protein N' (replication factor Y) (superfamily II helicase)